VVSGFTDFVLCNARAQLFGPGFLGGGFRPGSIPVGLSGLELRLKRGVWVGLGIGRNVRFCPMQLQIAAQGRH
jgi:hypothetical protein